MHITIDREPRGEKEGMALCVIARQNASDIYQFKIDVWTEKRSGLYRLRLDGFNFVRFHEAETAQEIFLILTVMDATAVEQEAARLYAQIRQALKDAPPQFAGSTALPDMSELAVGEYFEAARAAMLKELTPLMQTGSN
jgi:hypothetical protein